jgi:hypothetical protein
MRRPLAVLALALLAAPLHAGDPLPVRVQADTYRARFPDDPEEESKKLAVGAGQSVPVVGRRATDPKSGAVFAVTVADYPPAFAEVPAEKLLDGVRDGLKGKDGKVKAEEERTLGPEKHPGRAVRIEAGKNTVRARLFLVGTRLYQVTVAGATKTFPEKASDEFFAAFEPTR